MSTNPRCEWMTEKSAKFRAMSARVLEKRLVQVCRSQGLEEALCLGDYEFLAAVARAKTPDVNMAQIARLLGVNPSSATRRNRRLLECGLVTRTADTADERRYRIALTEAGRMFCDEMDREILEITKVIYSTITEEEFNAVFSFTEKCLDNLQKVMET